MEVSQHLSGAAGLLVSLFSLASAFCRWKVRRVHLVRLGAKVPGPPALPLFGNVLNAGSFSSTAIYELAMRYFYKYGALVRVYIGPYLIICSSHSKVNEQILSGYTFLNKSSLYEKFLKQWLGDGLLLSSNEKWRSRRKALTPAFHFRILEQFAPVFLSCGDEFVRQLRARAGGPAFDVAPLVKLLTLDVICETAMGVKINAQVNNQSAYVNAVEEIVHLAFQRSFRPWLYADFIFKLSSLGRKYQKCLDVLHGTTNRVIHERKEEFLKMSNDGQSAEFDIDELGRRRRVAFLDLLILAARDGSLSDVDFREEVDTFMFEGHDTTASALSFGIYLLSRHPDVQEKIYQELNTMFDPSKPLHPTLTDLSELKYLEMVIKEILRIYPPVTLFIRSITEDAHLPTGHVIPGGSQI